MAETTNDNKTISKNNAGFPPFLDFNKLREEGLDYLGKLSGKIWTDHNVHDPGITILEALCYALLDLGYRTQLPVADLFARDPEDKSADSNFLSPGQILDCNPLTITDFRKLLIDIDGVNNAWLEIATDFNPEKFCSPQDPAGGILLEALANRKPECCIEYLNGLYHVYLDLEKSKEEEIRDAVAKAKFVAQIKETLLSHRNICEDFIDIRFLCKWDIGVCAEIELEESADAEKVYLDLAEKLNDFFSPSPKFYTLQEMLNEKELPIDEIFAGRPGELKASHGFLDSAELELLQLRQSIHVSDVYNALFGVQGISKITRLMLRTCDTPNKKIDKWVVDIPENHISRFSLACSGFQFTRRGIPISFDFSNYETILQIGFDHHGKVAYTNPSDKLDLEFPKGYFRKDIDSWYSIQNDFPRVYAIGKGELSDDAPAERKAQALQLSGYLLFFDQLLANYLSQLKNIRTLFSLKAPVKDQQHTYFSKALTDAPGLDQLLRFQNQDGGTTSQSVLAFPVSRKKIESLVDEGKIQCLDLDGSCSGPSLPPYYFCNLASERAAANQFLNDFLNANYSIRYITKDDDCIFFYVFGSSAEVALVSRHYFSNEEGAKTAAATISYAGAVESSYRPVITSGQRPYSFTIELQVSTYSGYLQMLVEDEATYFQRRNDFLDHLLARFAESFTDYSLLSYGYYSDAVLHKKEITAKEFFLAQFPALSSNRGKAMNYGVGDWKTPEISGVEKYFKAITGLEKLSRESLCNFEVYRYTEKFVYKLEIGDEHFESKSKYNSKEEAAKAAADLFSELSVRENYWTEPALDPSSYKIHVNTGYNEEAELTRLFQSKSEADAAIERISRMYGPGEKNGGTEVAVYKYIVKLTDANGQEIWEMPRRLNSEAEGRDAAIKSIRLLHDGQNWHALGEGQHEAGKWVLVPDIHPKTVFVDIDEFKIDVNNTTLGKPNDYTFEILDKANRFKFTSTDASIDEKEAWKEARQWVLALANFKLYEIMQDESNEQWRIWVRSENKRLVNALQFSSSDEAWKALEEIEKVISTYCLWLKIEAIPFTWRFLYSFGYRENEQLTLKSAINFRSEEEARQSLSSFAGSMDKLHVEEKKKQLILATGKGEKAKPMAFLDIEEGSSEIKREEEVMHQLLKAQQNIEKLKAGAEPENYSRFVHIDEGSKCQFVYQLVDKDNQLGIYFDTATDAASAETKRVQAIQDATNDYNLLDLYLHGNISIERLGEDGKTKWYHYQLVSRNLVNSPGGGLPQRLVLFESTHGYTSADLASEAGKKDFMRILRYAMNADNYGENKPISEVQLLLQNNDPCQLSESIVYVPSETMEFLGTYPQKSVEAMVEIAKSFPVRILDKNEDCEEFSRRFRGCKENDCGATTDDCNKTKPQWVYFFCIYDKGSGTEKWQSREYYDSFEKAWERFQFFLILLKYEGNFVVECLCTGKYSILIREVLAESVDRFETRKDAWGKNGIQQFIKVAQKEKSFFGFQDEKCCYKFYLACPGGLLIHPCTYDSPEMRNSAMALLYKLAQKLDVFSIDRFCRDWNGTMIDASGTIFATVHFLNKDKEYQQGYRNYLEGYTDVLRLIQGLKPCMSKEELYFNMGSEKSIHFRPLGAASAQPAEIKAKLLAASFYFPIVMKRSAGKPQYCLDIKFPGFDKAGNCETQDDSEGDENSPCKEFCASAWVGQCCYDSCSEVINAFNTVISWLKNPAFYRAYFECECGPYGIALLNSTIECVKGSRLSNAGVDWMVQGHVEALNPQCYTSPEMACDAIRRAKALVNREGLHFLEHILLRPYCKEDCECRLQPCEVDEGLENCQFPFWRDNDKEDPCDKRDPVCFAPGRDPYSFIATVVLPSWPLRYQKKENRALIENILQREAPAHVLLRILWMAPHDLCCFEQHYKKWVIWMAYQKYCGEKFDRCSFINDLFHRPFECFDLSPVCTTCDDQTAPVSCVDELKKDEQEKLKDECQSNWLDQVNEIYCWAESTCTNYRYVECLDVLNEVREREIAQPAIALAEIHDEPKPALIEKAEPIIDKAMKAKFINSRFASYKKKADDIVSGAEGNRLAQQVRRYLEKANPQGDELKKLGEELLQEFGLQKKKKENLNKKHAQDLLEILVHYSLDKTVFNGASESLREKTFNLIQSMALRGVRMAKVYRDWNPDSVGKFEPGVNLDEIKNMMQD